MESSVLVEVTVTCRYTDRVQSTTYPADVARRILAEKSNPPRPAPAPQVYRLPAAE